MPLRAHTSKGKLWRGLSASLIMPNKTEDLAEAGHGQETAVLRVCNLPYFTQNSWCELGAFEELDGNLACYYAELLCVGLLEEILEDALLFWCEVENGLVCACLAPILTAVQGRNNILNSPLAERSAMTVELQMLSGVVVMVDACTEAEAWSCRVIARGSCVCVFPGGRAKESREAGGGKTTQLLDNSNGRPQLQVGKRRGWG